MGQPDQSSGFCQAPSPPTSATPRMGASATPVTAARVARQALVRSGVGPHERPVATPIARGRSGQKVKAIAGIGLANGAIWPPPARRSGVRRAHTSCCSGEVATRRIDAAPSDGLDSYKSPTVGAGGRHDRGVAEAPAGPHASRDAKAIARGHFRRIGVGDARGDRIYGARTPGSWSVLDVRLDEVLPLAQPPPDPWRWGPTIRRRPARRPKRRSASTRCRPPSVYVQARPP